MKPYSSLIGHGASGLRDNLRPFDELAKESGSAKHVWIDCRPSLVVDSWTGPSSDIYTATVNVTHLGWMLEVIGVRTPSETLDRTESSTPAEGQFYFDPDLDTANLKVRLTDDVDPDDTTVVVQLGVYFANVAGHQPTMARESLLTNGDFEGGYVAEVEGDVPEDWTASGLGAISEDTDGIPEGSSAVRLVSGGGTFFIGQDFTAVSGKMYRLSGWYRVRLPGSGRAEIRVGDGTDWLSSDGRSTGTAETVPLSATAGEWRRFVYDFYAPTTSLTVRLIDEGGGDVSFDDVRVRRIYRWNFYEPRLNSDFAGITTETGRSDIFFGAWETGVGALNLLNDDDATLDRIFGLLDWIHQEVVYRQGGRFLGDGNEILFDDCPIRWAAIVSADERAISVKDDVVVMTLEDIRARFNALIPPRVYTTDEFPNLAEQDKGRPRPLLFGEKEHIRPARVDTNQWEIADPTDAPAGIVSIDAVYSYLTEEDAFARNTLKRVALVGGSGPGSHSYVPLLSLAGFTSGAPKLFEITADNNVLDFDIGGGALTAIVPAGLYLLGQGDGGASEQGLCQSIRQLMDTAAGGSSGITVSRGATHITIAKSTGTLNLYPETGANKAASIFSLLGFTDDRTGSLSYQAENQYDKEAILRVDATGYKDDASGTYTGSAGGTIQLAPDIVRYILQRILGFAPHVFDDAEFVAARTDCPQELSVYVGTLISSALSNGAIGTLANDITLRTVLERIETSVAADVLIDGVTIKFRARQTGTPAGALTLFDRHILDYEGFKSSEDAWGFVQVLYDQDPATGQYRAEQSTITENAARFRTSAARLFATYLKTQANALTRLAALVALADAPPRHHIFRTRRLTRHIVGDVVVLDRARGLVDPFGVFGPVAVRIVRKLDDPSTMESHIEAVTNVS